MPVINGILNQKINDEIKRTEQAIKGDLGKMALKTFPKGMTETIIARAKVGDVVVEAIKKTEVSK